MLHSWSLSARTLTRQPRCSTTKWRSSVVTWPGSSQSSTPRWALVVSTKLTHLGVVITLAVFAHTARRQWSPQAHLHVVGMLRFMLSTELAHSFLFCSCVYFCLYGPFNCISFHKFSRQLSAFSLCSCGLISALPVLTTVYLFMKVSFSPDVILCGWLGLN